MAKFEDYENKTLTRNYVKSVVIPSVYDCLVDDYGFATDDYDGDVYDHIHEIIDGMEEVIYNYQARKIAQAFDYCPFESVSELTGEKYENYNCMAYDIIYNGVIEEYNEEINSVD